MTAFPPASAHHPRTRHVAQIDRARIELVRMLLTDGLGELTRAALRQRFAARTQDLARITGAGVFAAPCR